MSFEEMPMRLLCRNRVTDFDAWWQVFSSHARAHEEAGYALVASWRSGSSAVPSLSWSIQVTNAWRTARSK